MPVQQNFLTPTFCLVLSRTTAWGSWACFGCVWKVGSREQQQAGVQECCYQVRTLGEATGRVHSKIAQRQEILNVFICEVFLLCACQDFYTDKIRHYQLVWECSAKLSLHQVLRRDTHRDLLTAIWCLRSSGCCCKIYDYHQWMNWTSSLHWGAVAMPCRYIASKYQANFAPVTILSFVMLFVYYFSVFVCTPSCLMKCWMLSVTMMRFRLWRVLFMRRHLSRRVGGSDSFSWRNWELLAIAALMRKR